MLFDTQQTIVGQTLTKTIVQVYFWVYLDLVWVLVQILDASAKMVPTTLHTTHDLKSPRYLGSGNTDRQMLDLYRYIDGFHCQTGKMYTKI